MSLSTPVDALVQDFEEHGYVILRQAIEPGVIAAVRAEMEAIVSDIARGLQAMDHIDDLYENEPFETRLATLFRFAPSLSPSQLRRNLHRRGMYELFFCQRVLDVVEDVLGPEILLYPNYTVRPKCPDDVKTLVLWHQDAAYTQELSGSGLQRMINGLRMVNVWTPLVPARVQNGCMQFVPRSHKLGLVPHVQREHYLEIADEYLAPRLDQAVDVELDPGDVALFSNLMFHCGLPNRSNTVRWSCDWRYQDATQSTLRVEKGHLARSAAHPQRVVASADEWARLRFS